MSKFVAGHVTKNVIFKIMNYLLLNANFALKLQGKCWKDDVVMLTAHLTVTIKRLTRSKQKVVLAALTLALQHGDTTLLKNQSAIKYLP